METPDVARKKFDDYLPAYLVSIHPGGRAVYLTLIFLVITMLASLPLVSVQVSVSGRGIIRPLQEKTRIIATTTGIVAGVFINEGDRILKSEPLIQIRSAEPQKNLEALLSELQEAESHKEDLGGMASRPLVMPGSQKYIREYEEYHQQIDYLELLHAKASRELDRHEGLFKAGLISGKEYDDLKFSADKSAKELDNFRASSLNRWQDEYYRQINRVRDLQARVRSMEEKVRLTTVCAPATGSMVEFKGIFEGSAVQAGSVIGVLSPESDLIGEFYISSRNIAFLRKGQTVHLQMDAFSAREWGVIEGHIYDISGDYLLLENQPVYRVKCRFDRTELVLRNGYSAKIRKGMTFQAICLVTRRTMFQLLADKAENWLNPAMHKQESTLQP